MPSDSRDVTVATEADGVATVTIHRPPNNFFDTALIAAIADAFEMLDDDPACRAIVLAAEGKHFCAGAALGGRAEQAQHGGQPSGRHLYDEAERLFRAATPVVAAVQGAAIGGGLGLACAADFRVGTPDTRCSANFARLGFHHGFALTVTLPPIVGQQQANELLMTGARIDGTEALRIGLLDRLVPSADLSEQAHRLAADIAASAPLAVRSIRATMRDGLAERAKAAMARERAEQDRLSATADFAEGVRATAERRAPNFQGK